MFIFSRDGGESKTKIEIGNRYKMLYNGIVTVTYFPQNADTTETRAAISCSLPEIELFAGNRVVAVSVTHDAYDPTPRVAHINDSLSHHFPTL